MVRISRLFLFVVAATAWSQPYLNLNFETSAGARIWSWSIGSTQYEYVLDTAVFHAGKQSLRIRSLNAPATGLGVVSQNFPLELLRGHHVRVSGWIKTESVSGYAAVWWRVDGADGVISLDNMSQTGPRGTMNWKQYSFERDVSTDGVRCGLRGLSFGHGDGVVRRIGDRDRRCSLRPGAGAVRRRAGFDAA